MQYTYFSDMFNNDNHATGVGLKKVKDLGGKDAILKKLKTTEEVLLYLIVLYTQ